MADNIILSRLDGLKLKYEETGQKLTDPEVIADVKQFIQLTKEYKELEPIIETSERYRTAIANLAEAKDTLATETTGQPQPADVGDGGFIATGTSPDGSKAITEVYFTEGKTLANLEFESAPNDPLKPENALAIAKMQDTQIKNNPPA